MGKTERSEAFVSEKTCQTLSDAYELQKLHLSWFKDLRFDLVHYRTIGTPHHGKSSTHAKSSTSNVSFATNVHHASNCANAQLHCEPSLETWWNNENIVEIVFNHLCKFQRWATQAPWRLRFVLAPAVGHKFSLTLPASARSWLYISTSQGLQGMQHPRNGLVLNPLKLSFAREPGGCKIVSHTTAAGGNFGIIWTFTFRALRERLST